MHFFHWGNIGEKMVLVVIILKKFNSGNKKKWNLWKISKLEKKGKFVLFHNFVLNFKFDELQQFSAFLRSLNKWMKSVTKQKQSEKDQII